MATPQFGLDDLTSAQYQAYDTVNRIVRKIEPLIRGVKDIQTSTAIPTASTATEGDAYIIGTTAGAWSAFTLGRIAISIGSNWYEITPKEGLRIWVDDEDQVYLYNNSSWGAYSDDRRLASVSVNATAATKTNLFTPPNGKKAIISKAVAHSATTALSGGTDYQLGGGSSADDWKTSVDLSAMTSANAIVITDENAVNAVITTASAFGIKGVTVATNPSSFIVDIFGYLI